MHSTKRGEEVGRSAVNHGIIEIISPNIYVKKWRQYLNY